MDEKVAQYKLTWNPGTDTGTITLKLQNGQVIPLPVGSAQEFAAIAAILRNPSVAMNLDTGNMLTDWTQVGSS